MKMKTCVLVYYEILQTHCCDLYIMTKPNTIFKIFNTMTTM